MKKIVLILSAMIFVIILATFLFLPTFKEARAHLQGDLYKGDHITINLNLICNDKKIDLSDFDMECHDDLFKKHIVNNDNGTFKTKGGVYGLHTFSLIIPADHLNNQSEDLSIILDYYNTNDWYIVNINCNINMETADKTYTGSITIDCHYNNGTHNQYIEDLLIEDNIIYAYFGM